MIIKLQVKLRVKQTLWSKLLFKSVLLLGRLRLISLERAVKIVNYSLGKESFKYKVGNTKWKKLKPNGKFVIE